MTTSAQSNSQNITQLLSEGKVSFSYKNAQGETRNAVGTTNPDLIPEDSRNTTFTATGDNVSYWDLNVNGVRTFNRNNLDESSVETVS